MPLTPLLKDLESELRKASSPLISLLNPKLSRAQIISKIKALDLAFADEVFDLYNWANGTDFGKRTIGEMQLFSLGIFFPFDYMVQKYNNYVYHGFWDHGLFPIFGSGGGDFFLIQTSQFSQESGKIFYYSPSNPEFTGVISIFDSLSVLISAVTRCYREGAYFYNFAVDRSLNVNDAMERKICREMNPESVYWKIFDGE